MGSVTLAHLKTAFSDCKEIGRPKFETGHIVGREEQIKRVQELLQERGSVVIHGFRGMGKTSLAHCVVDRVKINYGTLLWLNASSPESLQLCVANSCLSSPNKAKAQNVLLLEQLEEARKWIKEIAKKAEGPLLVVIDGLTDKKTFDEMPDFPPKIDKGTMHLLITATKADALPDSLSLLIPDCEMEELRELSKDDVTCALCKNCDVFLTEAEAKAARMIARTVNGHPLYMTVIISFLRSENLSFTSYQHKCFGTFDDTRFRSASHRDLLNTLVSGLPLLTDLMNHLGYCDVALIPLRLFEFSDIGFSSDRDYVDNIEEREKRARESKVNVIIMANRLEAYGLLTYTDDRQSLSVHTEIAAEFRERQKREGKIATLQSLCKILTSALEKSQSDWNFCSALYPHAIRCVEYMQEQNLFDAELVLRCGYMKSLLGGSSEARDLLSQCLQESERTTELQQAKAYMYLATVHRRLGFLPEALKDVEDGKAILNDILKERRQGEKRSNVEKCLSQMKEVEAEILMDGRDFERAMVLLTEVQKQPRHALPVSDVSRSALLANIARAQLGQKKYTLAHESYKRAITFIEKSSSQGATKSSKEKPPESPRLKLYQAYSHVSKALDLKEKAANSPSCLIEFREELDKCLEAVRGLPSSHRYYAWGNRSVARLRREEIEILQIAEESKREEIEDVLKKGFQAIRCCLECHLAIASGSHQKVGKACLNLGQLCEEWLRNDINDERHAVCKCAQSYFQLGLDILKPIADAKDFKGIRTKVETVEESLKSSLLDLSQYAMLNDGHPNAENPPTKSFFKEVLDLATRIKSSS